MNDVLDIATQVVEDTPLMVPCSQPDRDIVGLAGNLAIEGYVVLALRGRDAACSILPEEVVLDPAALRAALVAGIGSDGPMSRMVMTLTAASVHDVSHVAAVEMVEELRGEGAPRSDVRAAEGRAVAAVRAGAGATAGQLFEDEELKAALEQVQETMRAGLSPDILETYDDVAERLHLPTLNVLAWSPFYTAACYGWYASPGPDGRRRRLAGYRISAWAGLVGDDPAARAAFDGGAGIGDVLAGALSRHVGRAFPVETARRMVDAEFEPPVYARRHALVALSEVPPELFPADAKAQESFCALAWGLRSLWSTDRPGSFARLVGMLPESRWNGFAVEVALAGLSSPRSPGWMEDAIEARAGHVEELARLISRLAVMPALVLAGKEEPASEGGTDRAEVPAMHLITHGRDLWEILVAVAEWKEASNATHLAAVSGREGENLSWPSLHDVVHAPNGVRIVPLRDLRAIHDEGCIGPDSKGLDGLANHVSPRAAICALGGCYLASLRSPQGGRLGTLVMNHDGESFVGVELGGPMGGEAEPEAYAACEWLLASLNDGTIKGRPAEIGAHVDRLDEVGVQMADCGYDWRAEGNVRRAFDAFRPFLSPDFRDMPYEGLLQVVVGPRGKTEAPATACPPISVYEPPLTVGRMIRRVRRRLGALISGT